MSQPTGGKGRKGSFLGDLQTRSTAAFGSGSAKEKAKAKLAEKESKRLVAQAELAEQKAAAASAKAKAALGTKEKKDQDAAMLYANAAWLDWETEYKTSQKELSTSRDRKTAEEKRIVEFQRATQQKIAAWEQAIEKAKQDLEREILKSKESVAKFAEDIITKQQKVAQVKSKEPSKNAGGRERSRSLSSLGSQDSEHGAPPPVPAQTTNENKVVPPRPAVTSNVQLPPHSGKQPPPLPPHLLKAKQAAAAAKAAKEAEEHAKQQELSDERTGRRSPTLRGKSLDDEYDL